MNGTVPDDRWLSVWTTRAKDMDTFNVTTFNRPPTVNYLCTIGELVNQVIQERQVVGVGVVAVEPGRNRHCTDFDENRCEYKSHAGVMQQYLAHAAR